MVSNICDRTEIVVSQYPPVGLLHGVLYKSQCEGRVGSHLSPATVG